MPPKSALTNMNATIDVMIADEGWGDELEEPEQWAQRVAGHVLSHEMTKDAGELELSVLLTNDMQIAELNQAYRNKAGATNVLSFPADVDRGLLGDVVLARETVMKEAVEQGKSVADHATHLLTHGILHLLGYDHEHDADANTMEAREVALLDQLNISNPYG